MRNLYRKALLVIAAGLFCAACSNVTTNRTQISGAGKIPISTTPGLKNCKTCQEAGGIMISSVIEGLNTSNYEVYSRDFSAKFKGLFTKEIFDKASKATKENIGDFVNTPQYVGYWMKGDFTIMLWKAKCSKTKDDILIEMYVKVLNGEYKIEGLKLI